MKTAVTVLLAALATTACVNRNFVVDPVTVCRCDAPAETPCNDAVERWRRAVDTQIEVEASDFHRGETIGTRCESEGDNWFTNVWKPVDGRNHMLVGTLHHFNWNYDDDEDWNIHVIPDPAFVELIAVVEQRHPESRDNHVRCGEPHCMEAEISPDRQFWKNPWFFAPGEHPDDADDNGFSLLEGRPMGFYGPWVVDANHDSKSEIHPVPMIWWKERFALGNASPSDVFFLMLMQDNTGRFDDRDNFDCGGSTPPGFEPWTQSPVSGQFSVAFEADPNGPLVTFAVNEMFSRFVQTSGDLEARRDADDGTQHDLLLNGRTLVSVVEQQPRDTDLGVTFTDICLRPDGKLQGFLTIRSQVGGNDDRDEEGFHILYAARGLRERPPVRPPTVPADLGGLVLQSQEDGGSLRLEDGRLAGDLALSLSGTDPVASVELAAGEGRTKVAFTQDPRSRLVSVRVPLTSTRLFVTTASGRTSSLEVAALAPNPRLHVTRTDYDLELRLQTRYAAFREEGLADRTSAFAGYLNEALEKRDANRLQAVFHSATPLVTEWKIEATDVATGAAVQVETDIQRSAFGDDVVRVRFPAGGGAVELRAQATVTDAGGRSGTVEQRVRR